MQPPRETNPLKILINAGITIHQKVVAPAQGDVCNFTPSCSRFSKKALKKYGVICGSLMATDRLMRCNPWAVEHFNTYYSGIKNGKIYDPIENNFIFEKIKRKGTPRSRLGKDELMKLRSSDVLNLVTSKLQNTTGPVKLRNRDAHVSSKSLFNGAGVNVLLLILGQPVKI